MPVLAIISVLYLLFTTAYLFHINQQCDPGHITEVISSVTQQRYVSLIEKTEQLKNQLISQGEPDILTFNYDKLTGTDISLFILKEGKIIFWSDNSTPWNGQDTDSSFSGSRLIKLQNGWYQKYELIHQQYTIVGLSLIKHSYPYDNEYLVNHFQDDYPITTVPVIVEEPTNNNINDSDGNFLFGLTYDLSDVHYGSHGNIAFYLFLTAFVIFNLWLLYLHRRLNPFPSIPDLALVAFLLDALILRGLILWLKFPKLVYKTYFFNPELFASSWLNPSFGDLFLNGITIIIIAWAFYRYSVFQLEKRNSTISRIILTALITCSVLLIYGFSTTVRNLIFDSTLVFNFNNLLSFDLYSFTGLLLMVILSMSLLMFLARIFRYIIEQREGKRMLFFFGIPLLITLTIIAAVTGDTGWWVMSLIFFGFTVSYLLVQNRKIKMMNHTILLLITLSAALTWMINHYTAEKEKNYRLMVAAEYAQKDDPMAEFLFGQARDAMYKDTALAEMIFHEYVDDDLVILYIIQNYFSGGDKFWTKYNFQVTLCAPKQRLVIESDNKVVDCVAFFRQQILDMGRVTLIPDLALIQDNLGQVNYLGILTFENTGNGNRDEVQVFIELYPKVVPVDAGYLELLVDQSVKEKAGIYRYANARYKNGQLVASYGKYIYSFDITRYGDKSKNHRFFSKGGYSHLYYPTGDNNVLLISVPENSLLDVAAPFSFFLLIFLIIYALMIQINNRVDRQRVFRSNFKQRLQLVLFSVIVVSFIVVGGTSVYYIGILNRNKNMANLSDKARSIRIEVEHKLADKEILSQELKPYIQTILRKFNDVFATDINLFDVEGNLLGTSRERIFDEGLISSKMNTDAYREMVVQRKTLLIHEENIGKLNYLSAYIPFKNNMGNIIAYINLPYFARQSELSDEISNYLMAYINIYLLLIAITILFAFLISDMIAKPLILIREKIRKMKLGEVNERIEWEGHDELGELVHEYNRMIDELEKSADLLARSERESAWREMARQVAHEIKNPLTPMKLNLQHLEKTLNDDPDMWKQQFEKFSRVMHQQIESLSAIASAFSDFANMPKGKVQKVEISHAVNAALNLFSGYPDVEWVTDINLPEDAVIVSDPEQFSRMIINLVNNALQAKVKERQLVVTVYAGLENGKYVIRIHDNGKGIDEEIRDKIFLPSFTTKTSGMGLGLAIARNIAESIGGTITFTSDHETGTNFTITIPVKVE